MKYSVKRKLWSIFDIKFINFRPLRYLNEIIGKKCPICYGQMSIPINKLTGCTQCSFWAHQKCMVYCDTCPQCSKERVDPNITSYICN